MIACQELGYRTGRLDSTIPDDDSTESYVSFSDIQCVGNEPYLHGCLSGGMGSNQYGCPAGSVVGLQCSELPLLLQSPVRTACNVSFLLFVLFYLQFHLYISPLFPLLYLSSFFLFFSRPFLLLPFFFLSSSFSSFSCLVLLHSKVFLQINIISSDPFLLQNVQFKIV